MRVIIEIEDEKKVKVAKDGEGEQTKQMEEIDLEGLTQEEAERYEAASDLANCCEYMEEAELIKLKLLVERCKARKERGRRG